MTESPQEALSSDQQAPLHAGEHALRRRLEQDRLNGCTSTVDVRPECCLALLPDPSLPLETFGPGLGVELVPVLLRGLVHRVVGIPFTHR